MSYRFDASYCYAPGERYNSGRGLSVHADSLEELEGIFRTYLARDAEEPYALTITHLPSGKVVKSHRDMKEATRSMLAATKAR